MDHDKLSGLAEGDPHTQYLTSARHSAVNHDGLVINHEGLDGVSPDQHHDQQHAHDGVDGSGTVSHDVLTNLNSGDPHPQYALESMRKAQRQSTGSIAGLTTATVRVTWTVPWVDTNYTAVASLLNTSDSLVLRGIRTIAPEYVEVRVENTMAGALTGTVHVIAEHD